MHDSLLNAFLIDRAANTIFSWLVVVRTHQKIKKELNPSQVPSPNKCGERVATKKIAQQEAIDLKRLFSIS